MSIDFILPDIGEGIVECELVEWLVSEGENVVEDQPVADVMTDKALVQIPAMHSGVIDKLYYNKGDIAKVHKPLFSMNTDSYADSSGANDVESSDGTQLTSSNQQTVAASVATDVSASPVSSSPVSSSPVSSSPVNSSPVSNEQLSNKIEDFILPDIGEGIVECELVEWLVNEGDIIEEDQPIADVMTDKALVQIPAMYAGKVIKLYYAKGEIAKVHSPLFSVELSDSATGGSVSVDAPQITTTQNTASTPNTPSSNSPVAEKTENVALATKTVNAKALASPAVRRVARELDVNIHEVPGTGKKGRVYKEDVVAFSNSSSSSNSSSHSSSHSSSQAVSNVSTSATSLSGGIRVEPIRGIKAAMAKSMVNSVATIPHFTYCEEIDMTKLIKLRKELKDVYAKQDIKLTMMPFFMKAMSLALKQFPVINSQVNDDCTELTYFDDHNIGMAVDSKVGLLVPNVKQVQNKSILALANDITRLTDDARSGRVSPADLKGGTITISNIGAIGGTVATPIINKPETAIVALGKLQTLPRFNDVGEVEARSIMQVSWSGDHRVIDGGSIARFCNLWKSFLEEPTNMLVHMS